MSEPTPASPRAPSDLLALGIAVCATLLVTASAATAISQVWRKAEGLGMGPDQVLINALLLNIALVIFGWRRYDDLRREIMDHRRRDKQAALMARTDPLTGCLDRYSIAPHCDAMIAAAHERGEMVAFIMINVNNFKQINETKGHATGDAMLREFAQRMLALAPQGALVGRLGGDEFACVLPFAPGQHDRIEHLAAAFAQALDQPLPSLGLDTPIGLAIGIARSDHRHRSASSTDAAALLHMADIALYQAKKHDFAAILWFEPTMESELRYRCEMETALRNGIAQGEFVPYYEQQIDLGTGTLRGFEMLARWHSPVFGSVAADVFIPMAEEIGVIAQLSEQLIAQALRDAAAWDPHLTLSVNISPLQLRDPWFAQKLLKILVAANFPASRLDVEITETCLHQNVASVASLITSLRNQGMTISLDDFGTGYSSLLQLARLPFDRLKIDRSFTSAMEHDPQSRTIVETIIALGKGLGMTITVEGIETAPMLAQFAGLGKFTGQGYLYGPPMSAQDTAAMLAARQLLAEPAAPEQARRSA